MSNVFQFPDRMNRENDGPYSEAALNPPLLGLPRAEVIDRVFESNFEFLGVDELDNDSIDCIEFFVDSRQPGKVLVDIEAMPHRLEIRGLYYVDLSSFVLVPLSDNPLVHFV